MKTKYIEPSNRIYNVRPILPVADTTTEIPTDEITDGELESRRSDMDSERGASNGSSNVWNNIW